MRSEDLAVPLPRASSAGRAGDFLAWEYYDVGDDPPRSARESRGWPRRASPGPGGRAYRRTGDPRFAHAARGALVAFTVPSTRAAAQPVSVAPSETPMPWYVERAYPGANPWKGAALNGFMVTLLNLRAVAPLLGAPNRWTPGRPTATASAAGCRAGGDLARAPRPRGERTLAYLPLHDTGIWSLYGLLTPGRTWRTYVADAGYHCYHVPLLRQLAEGRAGLGFALYSARWNQYALNAGVHCRPSAGPERTSP